MMCPAYRKQNAVKVIIFRYQAAIFNTGSPAGVQRAVFSINPAGGGPPGHLPRGSGTFFAPPLRFPKYLRNTWVYRNKI